VVINSRRFCNSGEQCSDYFSTTMNTSNRTSAGQASGALHMVSEHDLNHLETALNRGNVPTDFEGKLGNLATQSLLHRSVERNCRLFIALLQAAHEGSFKGLTEPAKQRLLGVLAYVRKDDDEIPDYKPNGFADDQREVHAAAADLGSLLNVFKSWRLCHQVPGLWNKVAPTSPQNSHLVEPTATRALRF